MSKTEADPIKFTIFLLLGKCRFSHHVGRFSSNVSQIAFEWSAILIMARFIMSSLVNKHGLKYAVTASPNVPIDT
jgi:hypothetical protein